MKNKIQLYLAFLAAILIALVCFLTSDKKSFHIDNHTSELNAQVPIGASEPESNHVQQTEPTHTLAKATRASQSTDRAVEVKTETVSSPNWRPPAVFARVMQPLPQRQYPRGENNTRRYHEPVSRHLEPMEADETPIPLAA